MARAEVSMSRCRQCYDAMLLASNGWRPFWSGISPRNARGTIRVGSSHGPLLTGQLTLTRRPDLGMLLFQVFSSCTYQRLRPPGKQMKETVQSHR